MGEDHAEDHVSPRLAALAQQWCSAEDCPDDTFSIVGESDIVHIVLGKDTSEVLHRISPDEKTAGVWRHFSAFRIEVLFTLLFALFVVLWYTNKIKTREHPPSKVRSSTPPKENPASRSKDYVSAVVPYPPSEVLGEQTEEEPGLTQESLGTAKYVPCEEKPLIKRVAEFHASTASATTKLEIQQVENQAKEMSVALSVAQTCLQEAGHRVEAKDLIPWIVQQQMTQQTRAEKLQEEGRKYMFKAYQKEADREESRRQHSATSSIRREDPQWMDKVKQSCNGLVEEVERSAIRVLLIAACGQSARWLLRVLQTTQVASVGPMLASSVSPRSCDNLPATSPIISLFLQICPQAYAPLLLSTSFYPSSSIFASACWMACAIRVVLAICGVYTLLQVRYCLPSFVREIVTTMAMGLICLVAVTRHYLSAYWYGAILLMAVGYLCAHWQYFRIKSRLRKTFPGKNPTSHVVNEALDSVETHRWWIATMTPIFGLTQVAFFLHQLAMQD